MTGHFVYVLRGWIRFRFAGVDGDVTSCTRAAACRSPAACRTTWSRAPTISKLIEINLPAASAPGISTAPR